MTVTLQILGQGPACIPKKVALLTCLLGILLVTSETPRRESSGSYEIVLGRLPLDILVPIWQLYVQMKQTLPRNEMESLPIEDYGPRGGDSAFRRIVERTR